MLLEIRPPIGNTRGPLATELLLKAVHRLGQTTIQLMFLSEQGSVRLAVDLPDELRSMFMQELQDSYPGAIVHPLPQIHSRAASSWSAHLRLQPDILKIRTHEQFLDTADGRQFSDPISGILSAIRTGHSGKFSCSVGISIQPITQSRFRQTKRIVERHSLGFVNPSLGRWYINMIQSHHFLIRCCGWLIGRIAKKDRNANSTLNYKEDEPLFECGIQIRVNGPRDAEDVARRKLREIIATFSRFNSEATFEAISARQARRKFLMSTSEIATLWHPLTTSGDAISRMERSTFKEVEPPLALTTRKGRFGGTVLGRVKYQQQQNQFQIAQDDLRRHLIAVGKTGCGKSTFLLNVVRQQIEANRGIVLVDPHGQLAEEVLDVIPRRRTNDVIYFDASDRSSPAGFNPMVGPPGTDPTLIADGVLTSFKNVFGFAADSAPRLLHIFRNCLLSLIGTPHASLNGVQRILVDANFHKSLVSQVTNQAVREFWLTEFNRWNDRDRTQYIASLQNKLGAFTTNEQLQRILNAGEKGIHLRQVMDSSRIMICNLSKGTVGHDASTLLGSLLLSSLQVAAMSRADIPESERTDCTVVIDEFHSYLSDGNTTMADALAESRKYRTSYVLSTQMLDGQLDPATLTGVLGNCGSTLCMTVGPRDAETLSDLLSNGVTPEDLMRIPKYHGYLRMLVDGAPHTFSMQTDPLAKHPPRRGETIRKLSRQRYGNPIKNVKNSLV